MWKTLRLKLAKFFTIIACIAWAVLLFCIALGQYVGVYIFYVCLPIGVIGGLLAWWLYPKDD